VRRHVDLSTRLASRWSTRRHVHIALRSGPWWPTTKQARRPVDLSVRRNVDRSTIVTSGGNATFAAAPARSHTCISVDIPTSRHVGMSTERDACNGSKAQAARCPAASRHPSSWRCAGCRVAPYRGWRSHPRAVEAPGKALGDDGPADTDTPRIAGERRLWRVRGRRSDMSTCPRLASARRSARHATSRPLSWVDGAMSALGDGRTGRHRAEQGPPPQRRHVARYTCRHDDTASPATQRRLV
jgi:hypothetical protein